MGQNPLAGLVGQSSSSIGDAPVISGGERTTPGIRNVLGDGKELRRESEKSSGGGGGGVSGVSGRVGKRFENGGRRLLGLAYV